MRELADRGYIESDAVQAFDGIDLVISLTPDQSRPQKVLIGARLPDGTITVLLGDGSAQQVSPRAYEEYRKQMDQPQHTADGSQRSRTVPSSPPEAAGSRR